MQSLSYQFEGRLELHIIGGFADTRRISHQLSVSLLRKLCVSLELNLLISNGEKEKSAFDHPRDKIMIISISEVLHKQRTDLDLITCCIGELCTLHRNGVPWPIVYGIGINVKSGDIFPAQFTDKGPDLDIRMARTLTGGDNVGVSTKNTRYF